MREFQLMTGQHFRLGIDQLNANVPGTYEWVKQEELWDDGSLPYLDEKGELTVPSLRLVDRGYYRLVPSQTPQPSGSGRGGRQETGPNVDDLQSRIAKMVRIPIALSSSVI
jgi:hypothetical protein